MELVGKLLYGVLEGLFWGVIFLFVAFIVLPPPIIDHIVKRLRPDWVSKTNLVSRIKLVFDYILNNKDVVVSTSSEEHQKIKESEINSLIQEKRKLENNLFFLDMLKSLSSVLYFSVSRSGYDENTATDIIEQAMEYLMHYGNHIQDTDGAKNQKERIYQAANNLGETLRGISEFKMKSSADEHVLLIAKHSLQQGMHGFNEYMKNEYESVRSQLVKTNQVLAQKLMEFVEA